ncbi:hypothetical protein C2845_PM01G40990 [Panicum miliaceum]|uniref:Uncharacterized protein n=1 Tax=Panicum miliaceum TaxID=4540 RepID=A0A3L6TN79_PANMI|nr:hypothetical protein C2845_PM01G40990 [Panicum miliaceum]
MLVEAAGVEVVEGDKTEDLAMVQAMVQALALGTVRLVGMGLMVERMLREAVKVVEEEVDKMVGPVMALVLAPGMVKRVGTGPMAEGMPRVVVKVAAVVGKVVQAAADTGMAQEVVLDLLVVVVDTHKPSKLLQKCNYVANILTSLYYGSCVDVLDTYSYKK